MTKKSAKFYDSAKKLYKKFGVMCTLRKLGIFHSAREKKCDCTHKHKPFCEVGFPWSVFMTILSRIVLAINFNEALLLSIKRY